MTKKKNLQTEIDDRWRTKGHPHWEDTHEPKPCPNCKGFGKVLLDPTTPSETGRIDCNVCGGTGEID